MKNLQSRRNFVKLAAAGTAGAFLFSNYSCSKKIPGIGLQLYTIRDAMTEDPAGSLKKVAEIGYKYMELAGYADGKFYGYEPVEFKKMVNDLGMEILSSHTQVEAEGITLENATKMAEDHANLGVKYCIQPWVVEEARTTIASYQKMAADWNKVGEIMKKHGIISLLICRKPLSKRKSDSIISMPWKLPTKLDWEPGSILLCRLHISSSPAYLKKLKPWK